METVRYGDYIPVDTTRRGLMSDNEMNIFINHPNDNNKYPLIIQIHGGGFKNFFKERTLPDFLKNINCVLASFEYRRVNVKYKNRNNNIIERAIISDSNLLLSEKSDTSMYDDSYIKNFKNRTDWALKCVYDCVLQMNYLVENADQYKIDLNKVIFAGGSAGTLMCNYLTYVYSKVKNYNVYANILYKAQLNYSVESTSKQVFELYNEIHKDKDAVNDSDEIFGMKWNKVCQSFLNPECLNNNTLEEICVEEHEEYIKDTYCNASISSIPLEDLANDEKLFVSLPLADLKNIIKNSSVRPNYVFVDNSNIKEDIPHNSLYATYYEKIFKENNFPNYCVIVNKIVYTNNTLFNNINSYRTFILKILEIQTNPTRQIKKNERNGMFIIITTVFLILLVIIIGFFILRNKTKI